MSSKKQKQILNYLFLYYWHLDCRQCSHLEFLWLTIPPLSLLICLFPPCTDFVNLSSLAEDVQQRLFFNNRLSDLLPSCGKRNWMSTRKCAAINEFVNWLKITCVHFFCLPFNESVFSSLDKLNKINIMRVQLHGISHVIHNVLLLFPEFTFIS